MSRNDGLVPLAARLLVAVLFLVSGVMKLPGLGWSAELEMVAAKGLPLPSVALSLAMAVEIVGGLALLFGFGTRAVSWILFLYLIPTTLLFHDFWAAGPEEMQMQMVNFLKNLGVMGGLLEIAAFGPGRISVDEWTTERRGLRLETSPAPM